MVLVPLGLTQLPPTVINVPGPGPTESHSSNLLEEPPPPPPLPEKKTPVPGANGQQEELVDGDTGSDQEDTKPKADDPYANLSGVFGSYLADEPRPMAAMDGRGRNDLDDLLF